MTGLSTWLFILVCELLLVDGTVDAQNTEPRRPDPETAHDPSAVIVENGTPRLLCTGWGLQVKKETADGRWLTEAALFSREQRPSWHAELVPENRGHLWAPDILRTEQRLLVYYSVSSFGKNTSAIGLVEGKTLDPNSDDWHWKDRGPVLRSQKTDRFNAIDPAVFAAPDGRLWMSFGSFWDGIHLVELNPRTGLQKDPLATPLRVAWSPEIEAPFLTYRNGWYYLFVNHGKCCRGVDSTYEILVGRSQSITGPYLDDQNHSLLDSGGRSVLTTHQQWIGPGHASLLDRDGTQWLVHHYYDKELHGKSRIRMLPLTWDDRGWPKVAQPTP